MANEESKQGSKREFWRAIVDRYDNRAAGVTLEAFCRREGVNASTMFQWRRRFQAAANLSAPFVRVHVAEPEFVDEGVEVITPDGFTIRLTSRKELGDAMRILRDASY